MSGYASRNHPSEGVLQRISAKALAFEDERGGRAVVVTVDLVGLPREVSDRAAAALQKQCGLERSAILFNASHTHTGPVVWPNLKIMLDPTPEQRQQLRAYSQRVTEALVAAAGGALGSLQPASVALGHGNAGFAVNRREVAPNGIKLGVNPNGPVDHDVPVLRVSGDDGKLIAVLFGYACHNTTLTGEHYQISGDYAGQAQSFVEGKHPGTTAMFLMLCGGDQNPNPRSKVELAVQHGRTLADEVERVLEGKLKAVRPPVRTAFRIVEPRFAPHDREAYEKEAASSNVFLARRGREMLQSFDERKPIHSVPYPVQAIRFGRDLTLVALGGEVVVDYGLRIKKEYADAKEDVVVAGYSNDVMCYIPTQRVLKEGGYEAVDSMIYYGQPGPFGEGIEDTVMEGVRSVMARVGRKVK